MLSKEMEQYYERVVKRYPIEWYKGEEVRKEQRKQIQEEEEFNSAYVFGRTISGFGIGYVFGVMLGKAIVYGFFIWILAKCFCH